MKCFFNFNKEQYFLKCFSKNSKQSQCFCNLIWRFFYRMYSNIGYAFMLLNVGKYNVTEAVRTYTNNVLATLDTYVCKIHERLVCNKSNLWSSELNEMTWFYTGAMFEPKPKLRASLVNCPHIKMVYFKPTD